MAQVLQAYPITHPNQAVPPVHVGLYVGRGAMSQAQLTNEETSWMQNTASETMLNQLAQQEARRQSWRYLYGHDSTLLSVIFTLLIVVFMLLVIRLLFIVAMRLLPLRKSTADIASSRVVIVQSHH